VCGGARERAAVVSEKQAEWPNLKMTVQVSEAVFEVGVWVVGVGS
jgi:hypothetical protein